MPKHRVRKPICGLLVLMLAMFLAVFTSAPAQADEPRENVFDLSGLPASEETFPTVETEVAEITNYGDLVLDITIEDLYDASYLITDVVALEVDGERFIMPLVTAVTEAVPGRPALIAHDEEAVKASIPYARLAEAGGLSGVVAEGDAVRISMVRRGGYAALYPAHILERTYQRDDYESDEAYANYRAVDTTGMGKGAFIRSSSPIDDQISRAWYAATLDEAAGVGCVLNFTDNPDKAARLASEARSSASGYARLIDEGLVCAIAVDTHLGSDDYREGLVQELRFMAEHEGPYLIHCVEGKDRTGFACMLLEALVGASYDEVAADYLQTFVNYYHVKPGSWQYGVLQTEYVDRFLLKVIAGVEDSALLPDVDLQSSAVSYLSGLGLSSEEIAAIRSNLTRDYV